MIASLWLIYFNIMIFFLEWLFVDFITFILVEALSIGSIEINTVLFMSETLMLYSCSSILRCMTPFNIQCAL